MTISPNASTVWRNYETDGVPASGKHKVKKSAARTWGTSVETAIDAYSSGAGSIAKATRALLYADLAHAADVMAWVYADSTVGYNGIYVKVGGTGTGSWTRILDLPYDVIVATDAGAGTANAIVATTEIPVSESALILLNVFEANTGAATVAFNGGSALTIKTASGNDVASGGLVSGMALLGKITGSTFRMVSDQASAAIQAAAEAAQVAAEAAQAAAEAAAASALATVATYGGSAGADSSAAIAAMASALGFVRFGSGSTLVSVDITIDVPIEFQMGAYITVASTKTVTITNRIESPRQWIFRGAGLYVLGHDSNSGEDARQVHVSWFGAFPSTGTDQSGYIQAACTAMGNLRESVIEFDIGNYVMGSTVTVTRGCHIKGQGTRRTVFKVAADGFDVFTTGATAARFTGIQFELDLGVITTRDSAWINLQHDMCEVYDYFSQSAKYGIIVGPSANNARIRNVIGVYGAAPSAGSSLIAVRASNADIADVYCPTSSAIGPASIVHIGGTGVTGNISGNRVSNVKSICPSITVLVDASGGNVSRTTLRDIDYGGFAGTAPAQAIKFVTSGTYSITGATIDGFQISGYATAGITFSQGSSGTTENIVISGGAISGATGNGIEFIQTAGGLTNIRVDGSVDASDRATPFHYSGSTSNISIDPQALPNVDTNRTHYFSGMADDSAQSITLHRSIFSGTVIVTAGSARHGIFTVRAASSPTVSANRITDANTVAVNTALTGTTGTDGNLTLGVQNGVLYIENRLGSAQNISVSILGA